MKKKEQFFQWACYAWLKVKNWIKKSYEKLSIFENCIAIYENVIRPFSGIFLKIMQWFIAVIVCGADILSEYINDWSEWMEYLLI